MAERALPAVVIGWACVAGLAVSLAAVAEGSIRPGRACLMAERALPGIMVGWTASAVAALAVGRAGVIESGPAPGAGIVAQRALPSIMVGRAAVGVAARAVRA